MEQTFKITKTVYNDNLRTPDSYTVECAGKSERFRRGEEAKIGEWISSIWLNEFFPSPAMVYYNIDWDCDHVLFCKYETIKGV